MEMDSACTKKKKKGQKHSLIKIEVESVGTYIVAPRKEQFTTTSKTWKQTKNNIPNALRER